MGKDLKGCDRGECRLCSEAGDDCDEYVLQPDAKTTQVTSCRDCLHPPATHKKRTSPATDSQSLAISRSERTAAVPPSLQSLDAGLQRSGPHITIVTLTVGSPHHDSKKLSNPA